MAAERINARRSCQRQRRRAYKLIRKTILDNGIKIITEVVDEVYSASIGIWVDVGSEDESEKNNGVSHCLEHMLFKGTKTRSAKDIASEIEDVGGGLGAATSKENTCFYGRVMGDKLSVAIDLLTDMLLYARLDPEDLDLERQVILEEIKMYEDDPEDLSQETLVMNVWSNNPLGRPITGTLETVSSITSQMLREHVDRFYRPENMLISIAGKFDQEAAIDQFKQAFKEVRTGAPKPQTAAPKLTPCLIVKKKDIEQAHLSLAMQGLSVTDERRYELAVLDLCLGGNMSSRLFQEVREKRGLVYTINSYKTSHRLTGLFGVYAGTSPAKVSQVIELILEELRRIKQTGLTEQELKRAKTQLKSDLLLGLESMRNRTSRNAYGELFFGRQLGVEEICRDIEKVNHEGIYTLANDLISHEGLSLVLVGPASQLPTNYTLSC
ncbi:MAG: insulinase family protein [Candidatus Melainabacteria bacterium]|nr:insulinase family protein [Candidatus Melainabacteria bacterium]